MLTQNRVTDALPHREFFTSSQFVIAEVYSPVVSSVLDCLRNIHADVMPGLPFPELPVITVTGTSRIIENPSPIQVQTSVDLSGGSLFLDHLGKRLDLEVSEDGEAALTMVNHLYPNNCLNLTTAMKNLISGFIGQDLGLYVSPRLTLGPTCFRCTQTKISRITGAVRLKYSSGVDRRNRRWLFQHPL